MGDRLLLFGHDEGLSVLNMFPQEWGEDGLVSKGPEDAQALPIWEGEAYVTYLLHSFTPKLTVCAVSTR